LNQPNLLAEIENFGKIYQCGHCDNIHLQAGAVSVSLNVKTYMQLVALINTSAANFETSIAWKSQDGHDHG
jgi:hypothetical protein